MNTKEVIELMGLSILLDDIRDIGKIDRLHHWQLGMAMIFKPEWFEDLF